MEWFLANCNNTALYYVVKELTDSDIYNKIQRKSNFSLRGRKKDGKNRRKS